MGVRKQLVCDKPNFVCCSRVVKFEVRVGVEEPSVPNVEYVRVVTNVQAIDPTGMHFRVVAHVPNVNCRDHVVTSKLATHPVRVILRDRAVQRFCAV